MRPPSTLHAPELDRLALLETEQRMRIVRRIIEMLVIVGLVAIGAEASDPAATNATVAAVALVLVASAFDRQLPHSTWPGGWLAAQETLGLAGICLVIGTTGGLESPALFLLAPAAALTGARRQGGPLAVALLMAFAGATVACSLASGGPSFSDEAGLVIAGAAALVAVALLSSHLAHADRGVRADSILDPLTGLLNRGALDARVLELRGQAALDGLPLSVVLSDLDALAQVNAVHGKMTGDAVLTGAAEAMRRSLRSFELLYRLGGDEFLLLLPGATLEEARALAERLRDAVATARPDGQEITASFGVASGSGSHLQFGALLAEADVALYAAKADGGDQVRTAGADEIGADGPVPQPA
ncbi:MAG: GGDEF domain-containing protein [Solirubrobacteraceae bacterium]|nr:GGDEF domain-containing protein [Solirubrobacteraceae bacterium]